MDPLQNLKNKLLSLSDRYSFYEKQYELLLKEKNNLHQLIQENQKHIIKIEEELQLLENRLKQDIDKKHHLLQKTSHTKNQLKNDIKNIKKDLKILISIQEKLKLAKIENKQCPLCDNEFITFLPFGKNLRKNAQCPVCGSLERHRAVYIYFLEKTNLFKDDIKLLHFAPESIFADIFSKAENIDYLPVDLLPGPNIQKKVDIQNIPYENNSFEVIYCSHVLEHVPDDQKAINELLRVLKPANEGGYAVILVPINQSLKKTLENPGYNTPELRLIYYGQHDHLRYYGKDFPDKLKKSGFQVQVYNTHDIIKSEHKRLKYGIKSEQIFVCKKK